MKQIKISILSVVEQQLTQEGRTCNNSDWLEGMHILL